MYYIPKPTVEWEKVARRADDGHPVSIRAVHSGRRDAAVRRIVPALVVSRCD